MGRSSPPLRPIRRRGTSSLGLPPNTAVRSASPTPAPRTHPTSARSLSPPTFYSQLYPDLRAELSTASQAARTAATGVWTGDATSSGATVANLADLDEKIVILPKLFRRLIDYLALGGGDPSLDGFTGFLATRNDRLFVISEAHATGLDTIT